MADVSEKAHLLTREINHLRSLPLGVLEKKNELDVDGGCTGGRLTQLKDKSDSNKIIYTGLKTKANFLRFLESVDKENWPRKQDVETKLSGVSHNLKLVKSEVSDIKERLEEAVCLDEKYSLYEGQRETLEKKLSTLVEKKDKLQLLRDKYESLKAGQEKEGLQVNESKLKDLDQTIQACCQAIELLRNTLSQQRMDGKALKARVEAAKQQLNVAESFREHKNRQTAARLEKCQELTDILQRVTGLREHSASDRHLVVEVLNPVGTLTHPDLQLLLELQFQPCDMLGLRLVGAKVNIGTLDVSQLIQRALQNNAVDQLIYDVQLSWYQHVRVLEQIVTLRDRFAVDWIPEESKLRQMVGNEGNIVCTLLIPSTPPLDTIVLQSIEGQVNGSEVNIKYIQPPQDTPCLQDWLEYLECRFGGS